MAGRIARGDIRRYQFAPPDKKRPVVIHSGVTGPTPISLVLDQGVPRDAAERLRKLGRECIHVGELGVQKAENDEIPPSPPKGAPQ
jgi:hypothetical protein